MPRRGSRFGCGAVSRRSSTTRLPSHGRGSPSPKVPARPRRPATRSREDSLSDCRADILSRVLSSASALAVALALTAASPKPSIDPTGTTSYSRESLLTGFGRDVRAMPSLDNLRMLAFGTGGSLLLHHADDNVANWASGHVPSAVTDVGDVLGSGWVQGGGAAVTFAVGVLSHSPKATAVGSDLIRGQIWNGIATRGLKVAVGRERPNGGDHSFPSGHTSAT